MTKKLLIAVTALTFIISGCAQKKTLTSNGGNGISTGYGQGAGSSTVTSGNSGSSSSGYQNVDPYGSSNSGNGTYDGDGSYGQNGSYGSASGIKNIYFNVDQYAITADKLPIIANNANLLKSDISKGAKLKIEGHCDASGTDEYNYALGLRRAKSAKDAMVMKGIPARSMRLVSMGESSPECTSSDSSSCYAKNRRVEFKVVE